MTKTPKTDREKFIAAICENPADDLRRLAFADWLEENGDAERAVVIRSHIQSVKEYPDFHRIRGRFVQHPILERTLLETVTAWTSRPEKTRLSEFLDDLASKDAIRWSRGFVSCVRCRYEDWLTHGQDVVLQHPVENLSIIGAEDFVQLSRGSQISRNNSQWHRMEGESADNHSGIYSWVWAEMINNHQVTLPNGLILGRAKNRYFLSHDEALNSFQLWLLDESRWVAGLPLLNPSVADIMPSRTETSL